MSGVYVVNTHRHGRARPASPAWRAGIFAAISFGIFFFSVADILAAQLAPGGPIPPRQHNPAIPPAMENVILKCIAREPEHRYHFSGILVRELENALYV